MSTPIKIPVFLLSGFLGSGKTTFLNRILKMPGFRNSLVIVNEFGSVPVDHLLVEESAETIFELSNGCLCCNMRGELVETLAELDLEKFDRIFIETTGIADPLPVFQAIALNPDIASRLTPQGIVVVYDCLRGKALFSDHEEVKKQIAVADHVLLSKTDLADAEAIKSAEADIRAINQTATLQTTDQVSAPADLSGLNTEKTETGGGHAHSGNYKSVVLSSDRILGFHDLVGMLQLMIGELGSGLLRIKGFASVSESDRPLIIQVSGQILHEPKPLGSKQEHKHGIELVVITKDVDPRSAGKIFEGFTNQMTLDTADREALLNNPLTIPGM